MLNNSLILMKRKVLRISNGLTSILIVKKENMKRRIDLISLQLNNNKNHLRMFSKLAGKESSREERIPKTCIKLLAISRREGISIKSMIMMQILYLLI